MCSSDLGQLMPNSWRIVITCMEIWLAANEDMIKVSDLVHIYHLKESKEYGYYELVPWTRGTRVIKGLVQVLEVTFHFRVRG